METCPCTWSGCARVATTHRVVWSDRMAEFIETPIGCVTVDRADIRNTCDHHANLFDIIERNRAERAAR